MSRRYEADKKAFLGYAKKHGAKITVTTDARVVPRTQGTAVVMQPAILLYYVVTFSEEGEEQKRIHEETIYVSDTGRVQDIEGTLLDQIRKEPGLAQDPEVFDRTLALDPKSYARMSARG